MKDALVSLILPVYNVEKYLNKCIDTVVSQTYTNIEVILVDDGATDSSGDICDQRAENDSRIKVIHKANAGLGMARNSGLDVAKGEYVIFVDSDDFIAENMVERLLESAEEFAADAVYCSSVRYYDESNMFTWKNLYDSGVFYREDVIKKVLLEMVGSDPSKKEDQYIPMSVWHGMFSMDLIRKYGIRFHSEREFTSEDIIYDIDYLQRANCVAFIPDALYFYRLNNNSLSKKYNPDRFEKEKILYIEIKRKLGLILPEKAYIDRVNRMFLGRVRGNIMLAATVNAKNKVKQIADIVDDKVVRQAVENYPYSKNPMRQKIFNYCIDHSLVIPLFIMGYFMGSKNQKK